MRGRQTLARIREHRRRHQARSRLYRIVFATAGFCVVVGGILLLVLPGPGLVVIAIGLGMLALEFRWAERALERALVRLDEGIERIQGRRGKARKGAEPADDAREEAV